MKKRLISRALALIMALSLLSTTAFASSVTVIKETKRGQTETDYDDIQVAASSATAGSTVRLNENADVKIDADGWVNVVGVTLNAGVTLDLNDYELNVTVKNADKMNSEGLAHGGHIAAVGVANNANYKDAAVVKGGSVSVSVKGAAEEIDIYGIWSNQGSDVKVEDTNIAAKEGTTLTAGIGIDSINSSGNDDSTVTVKNTTVEGAKTAIAVKDEDSKAIISSGVFENLKTDDGRVVLDTENGAKKIDVSDAGSSTVIASKDTAAVVVDKGGNIKLYDSLDDAKAAVGTGTTVNVLKADATAPKGFEIEDGKLVAVEPDDTDDDGNNQGGGNDNPVVTTVPDVVSVPVDFIADTTTPATTIADEEVPLAGVMTYGELLAYLYEQAGSPNGKDAEGEYAKAAAWAYANGIADEAIALDETVTVVMLREALSGYAAYAGMDAGADIEGEDDMIVMNCDEILDEFFASLEAKAA